jgi:glycosyltransferase involved in cell wall biosynthesis
VKALVISNLEKKFLPGHHSMIDPLEELGYEVTWASNFTGYKEDLSKAPCKTVHIDFIRNPFNPKNVKAYKQLIKLLNEEKYDVIHCNTPIGGVLGRICGVIAKVPVIIYTAHGFHFYQGAPLINRTIFKMAEMWLAHYTDVIITINQEDYEAAQGFKLRNSGKVFYIPGIGVDTTEIKQATPKRQEILQEIKSNDSAIMLISVGELNKNKNNQVVIEALGKLQNPNIHYILCGIGNKKDDIISLAKNNRIEGNIHFFGYRNDIPQLLKSCDVFIMPSYREGLSRSIMEAMSAGLPCIVSRIRGNVDLIHDRKGGYLFSLDDVEGFAKHIQKLAENEILREQMGRYNVEAVKQFDVENVKRVMKSIYTEVLNDVGFVYQRVEMIGTWQEYL